MEDKGEGEGQIDRTTRRVKPAFGVSTRYGSCRFDLGGMADIQQPWVRYSKQGRTFWLVA